ncbi:MAG: hypothetical protein K6G22_09010 [Lachnospiraceae bacterium]|nr:hypothetical protein [Lachnospiraceae bacterium]
MDNKFYKKKQQVYKKIISCLQDKCNLTYNRALIQSRGNDIILTQKNEIFEVQYFRNVSRMTEEWKSLILELNDHSKQSPEERIETLSFMYDDLKEMFDIVKDLLSEYPVECAEIIDGIISDVKSELGWLTTKEN